MALLAFLPIIVLLVVSLLRGVRAGVFSGVIVTSILFFVWDGKILTYAASVFSAFIGTVNILMIIFGAVFLYQVMEEKNFINGLKASLSGVHSSRTFRFYFLAFFLTAFFESVAGFGTPGAIVPLLLMSLGYSPILSVSVVLLIDGLFAVTGAIGTPVTAGLAMPLKLSEEMLKNIYLYSGIMIALCGCVLVFFIRNMARPEAEDPKERVSWTLFAAIIIPFAVGTVIFQDLTGLIASLAMALFCYAFLFEDRKLQWKPWLPYWLLIIFLLIPKLFPPLAAFLNFKLEFNSLYGTEVSASFQPFRSPLIPFLAASFIALYMVKDYTINLKPILTKSLAVFVVLFPSLAVTQLMLNSGGHNPSMIDAIAAVFAESGAAYPLLSPLIGVIGAFISGSTTVSNVIFGSVQLNASENLAMNSSVILSLQLVGASLGNAVCLFNIIAAAAVAGIKDYTPILKKNLLPVLAASFCASILGYLLLYILS